MYLLREGGCLGNRMIGERRRQYGRSRLYMVGNVVHKTEKARFGENRVRTRSWHCWGVVQCLLWKCLALGMTAHSGEHRCDVFLVLLP